MGMSRIRKQVSDLTVADLRAHPIWEFASDEEGIDGQDEATVRPYHQWGDLDPEGGGQFLVLASFVLADGSKMQGHITPSRQQVRRRPPILVTDQGTVCFWQGIFAPSQADIAIDFANLGKDSPAQVFPIQFSSEVPLVGGTVHGQIPGFMVVQGDGSVAVLT